MFFISIKMYREVNLLALIYFFRGNSLIINKIELIEFNV